MGIAHGAFCVGCCWSLMLVMFGVGLGSLVAMLVLGGLDGDREEHALGPAAQPAARRGPDPGRGLLDRRREACAYPRAWTETATHRTRAERRDGRRPTRDARSSRRPGDACSPTGTPTCPPAASPTRPASRSARSTTTSAASGSSSWRCSTPRTSVCSTASGEMYARPEPLWGSGSRPATSSRSDLASGYVRVLQEMIAAGWSDAGGRGGRYARGRRLVRPARRGRPTRAGAGRGLGRFTPDEIAALMARRSSARRS